MTSQPTLFDMDEPPWEVDDQAEQLVATVIFPSGPAQQFDYAVPDELRPVLQPGARVRVPFGKGNRQVQGYCVQLETRPVGRARLKSISEVIDKRSLLSPAMLRLTKWIADYYLCDWGTVLEAVLPAGVRSGAGLRPVTLLSLCPEALAKTDRSALTAKQAAVLHALEAASGPMTPTDLARAARCTQAPINALRRKGLIRSVVSRAQRFAAQSPPPEISEPQLELSEDQRRALYAILAALHGRQHQTILIHGVTGSGKTEVYIRAIQEVVRFGRQAIVLVPEISLTPQTVDRFRARFGDVAVLHSHLTDAERHFHWQRIAEGKVSVVVGARSAVFAPTPHLGLIVLDEEHENSFKQDSAPRYHAREVALARARAENVPLVLGSATPSLDSWYRAKSGQYVLVEMPRRVLGRPLPLVGTIDLRCESQTQATRGAVSRQLHCAIAQALRDGGQVILLLNRRGYSTHIQCSRCGHTVRCPYCDIALTHHRVEEVALCHYCDYRIATPTACPQCQFTGIRFSGLGTQRLEAELRARFPNVACLRMDTDSMQSHGAHERAMRAFREGKVRILLGTQMIAKGLDFPDVTLVGVINADTALHLPDFRAAERTFQLVTQVAGRTGRGPKGGRVLVQTFTPDHPAIAAAVRHDYASFVAAELPVRQMLRYPPFASMIRVVVRGPRQQTAKAVAELLGNRLREALGLKTTTTDTGIGDAATATGDAAPATGDATIATGNAAIGRADKPASVQPAVQAGGAAVRVLGPAPAPFSRLRGQWRFHIQLQGEDGDVLRRAIRQASTDLEVPEDVHWYADVDPVDML